MVFSLMVMFLMDFVWRRCPKSIGQDDRLVVVLEGNPGTGKTTIKDNLKFDGVIIERIDQILPDNPDSDDQLVSADIVASDLLKSSKITKTKGKIIIMDRYIHSTLAYRYAYDRLYDTSTYSKLDHTYHREIVARIWQKIILQKKSRPEG